MNIAINGFGRIGRAIVRAYFENGEKYINEFVINSTVDLKSSIHLLKYDSTFRRANLDIKILSDNECTINNIKTTFISEKNLDLIDWKIYKIDTVMECSGKFLTTETAGKHLKNGAKRVILSAPAKDDAIKTVVYGVNNSILSKNDEIVSIGSCTTNCFTTLAKVLDDNFGIKTGFLTTVHAYTGDQNLLDSTHSDPRRARSAAMSMVPTSTGVSKALANVLPHLAKKVDGSAIRVPVCNVSIVDFVATFDKKISVELINKALEKSANSEMSGVLGFTKDPLVSVDFIQTRESGTVDALETKIVGENMARVLSWYDNEWGFSCRMLDILKLWNSL